MSNQSVMSSKPTRRKSPGLAAMLGFLLPGLGQIYCGQDNKGVFLLGLALLGHWLTGGVSTLILCPVMGIDAFMLARQINQGAALKRWQFFTAIRRLDSLPSAVVPILLIALVALTSIVRLLIYASDYHPYD
jgi:TM2 domain-containing membrane protein YozV